MEDNIKLYQGDCLEIMDQFIEQGIKVDAVITSPPYDNLRTYEGSLQWNEYIWKKIIDKLYLLLADGGVIVWVVGDATINGSESGTSFKQALYFKEVGFNLHDTMIYQKDNPPPTGGNNRYYQHFEYMFVFSKNAPKTFNPITIERRNKWNDTRTSRVKGFNRDSEGNFKKKEVSLTGKVKRGNIFKYIVGGGNSIDCGVKHPATFPQKLVEDQILTWSNPEDIILDPFLGSGTTGIGAKLLGRSFIGIEKVEEYFQLASERIEKEEIPPVENNLLESFI